MEGSGYSLYLVIGANGFLGSYIVQALLSGTREKILCVTRSSGLSFVDSRVLEYRLDIADWNAVDEFARRFQDSSVKLIMLATIHNPDTVAAAFRQAWNTNITSLSYLINSLEGLEALYYASTDSVYGESIGGYHFKEEDTVRPCNPYGRQKAAAEQIITQFGGHVVRYPFLIGESRLTHKKHFYDKIIECLSKGQPVEMLIDSYRSTLDFETAANLLVRLLNMDQRLIPPIVNIGGDIDLSKYDVGLLIADKMGVSHDLIVPVTIGESRIYQSMRASTTLMDNSLLKSLLKISEIRLSL